MPELAAIAFRRQAKGRMLEICEVDIRCEDGVVPDTRGKPGRRQVSVLSLPSWREACAELGADLPWTLRRANLLVDGLRFSAADVGRILRVGEVELELTVETDPCPRMDAQYEGLTAALMPDWRGGVCARVRRAGRVRVGDAVGFAD